MDKPPAADYRSQMQQIAQRLAAPFQAAAQTGLPLGQFIPFEAAPDTRQNRKDFNAVEGIVRLIIGLAPLMESQWHSGNTQLAPLKQLLLRTIAQAMPLFEAPIKGSQALVEAAHLAQAMLRAPNALWYGLTEPDRAVLRRALQGSRAIGAHQTNWLLFPAMVETALIVLDGSGAPAPVITAVQAFDGWYLGDGLYGDGPQNSFDYYGGFVMHPMLDDIARHLAPRIPALAQAAGPIRARFDRYCEVLERLIAPDGSFAPLGRSLAYRAGAFQPLAMAALRAEGHPSLSAARLRGALMAVTQRTMAGAQHYDAAGWLRIGLAGAQPALAETYISTGSLYLCTQALLPLALPAQHPFWSTPAEALTQEALWHQMQDIPADIALEKRQRPGAPRT